MYVRRVGTYPYPEEKCQFKRILEQDDMNQYENQSRPVEPKVIVWRLNHQVSFYCNVLLGNIMG